MKECLVCGALAFDDASVCYGCLHPFGTLQSDEQGGLKASETLIGQEMTPEESEQTQKGGTVLTKTPVYPAHASVVPEPPEFCIHLIPSLNTWGDWRWDCSVEVKEKVQHEVIGRHAVQGR